MKKHFSDISYGGMFEPVRDSIAEYKLGKLVYRTVMCRTNECPADKHNFYRQNNKTQCPTEEFSINCYLKIFRHPERKHNCFLKEPFGLTKSCNIIPSYTWSRI